MYGVDVMLFPGETPLIKASKWGRLPVVKYLVEHKANVDAKGNVDVKGNDGKDVFTCSIYFT